MVRRMYDTEGGYLQTFRKLIRGYALPSLSGQPLMLKTLPPKKRTNTNANSRDKPLYAVQDLIICPLQLCNTNDAPNAIPNKVIANHGKNG
mmetsp:Transcript_2600/g.3840  ORF Transcript_2600/g.3840 Transcript_2600/m.3840 type:complete len:91 (-) Transcript_2600:1249-1521(-)